MRKTITFFISLVCFIFLTPTNIFTATNKTRTPLWGIFETSFKNTPKLGNPFTKVSLDVTWISPENDTTIFWGFYDGDQTWRARFMPDKIGTWKYNARFSDGTVAGFDSFTVVPSNIPGPICQDVSNPLWFGFKGGKHSSIRGLHIGDRFFAANWPQENRTKFLDWAEEQGYNLLSVASFFLNRNVDNRGKSWDTPKLWDKELSIPNPKEYQKVETLLQDLGNRGMVVYPFAGFFGQSSDCPFDPNDQQTFIKYTIARLGVDWNLMFNIAGPEPLWRPDAFKNKMPASEIIRLGNFIKKSDPFDHLLSVHNETGPDPFRHEPWHGYTTLQGGKENPGNSVYKYIHNHSKLNKPVFAQEVFWPGNMWHTCDCNDTDTIRKKAFTLLFAGSTINFADMDGNSSSGFSGTLNLNDRHQEWHDSIKNVWDWFDSVPYHMMTPQPKLVNNGFLLAEHGVRYLVYQLAAKEPITLDLTSAPGQFNLQWYNPRTQNYHKSLKTISGGKNVNLDLPPNEHDQDWIASIEKTDPYEFVEENGFISIEAEHAIACKDWETVATPNGQAMRDNGERNKGFLSFPLNFTNPGHYYIYMLMRRTNIEHFDKANDAFEKFAGRKTIASDNLTRPDGIRCSKLEFTWESMPKGPGAHTPRHIFHDPIYVNVPAPGRYTLEIISRSRGFEVDKIILSKAQNIPIDKGHKETIRNY